MDISCHIDKSISSKVLMIGDYAGPDATGGMAAVIHNYRLYIQDLKYIHSWRPSSNKAYKLAVFAKAYFAAAFRLLFDRKIEVVHIHTCSGDSFRRSAWFVRLAGFFGKKIVLHMHGGRFKEFYEECTDKRKILDVIDMADVFVVLSKMWSDWFASIGVREEALSILNNMVIPPEQSAAVPGDGRLHLLFLGNVTREKGIYDLLDAIMEHKEPWKDRILLRIGGELKDDALLRMIEDNGLDSMVEYCGYVTGEKKVGMLRWCDVFVLPSYYEGLPMSVLEAMSYSRPVIATRVGGIPSVVIDMKNGFLVGPGDRRALSSAVGSFISDPGLVSEYGRYSAEIIRDYLPEKVMEELCGIYISLMRQARQM